MPKIANLSDASPEDVLARCQELREEFAALSDGRRTQADLEADGGLRAMVDEVELLDSFLTSSSLVQRAEQAKLAATAGALAADGFRSIGADIVTDRLLKEIERSSNTGPRTQLASFDFEGTRGKDVSNWLQLAGMYGADGIRAITEWGSSGPGFTGPMGTNYDTTTAGALAPRGQPIAPMPRQAKMYMRDLLPKMTTTLADVPYVRELNPVTYESSASGGALAVSEGVTKPTANLSFVAAHAPITTVASTLTLSKQMFADAPMVVQYVNNRLPYLVKLAEDAQILNGNGTWPNNQGILQFSGNGLLTSSAGTSGDYAVQIGNGFAKVENQDGAVTAVVMNPTDAWTMFMKRAAGGSGTFDAGTPFSTLPLTVWGQTVYRSRVYPQGSALVADWDHAGILIDREQVNVQVYNERYAEQNLVLLICEERLGVAWPRPDLVCQVTLS